MKEQDLSQVFYDMQTAKTYLKHLTDGELFDTCIMDIQIHRRKDLEAFYDKLANGENLTREERVVLENFYILTNIDFMVNE